VAFSCEHGNEPSCSIKREEFLDQLSVVLASDGLYSTELVCLLLSVGGRCTVVRRYAARHRCCLAPVHAEPVAVLWIRLQSRRVGGTGFRNCNDTELIWRC